MDCNPTNSSVHGIFQARTLEWVAISYSRDSSWPRDQTYVFCIDRQILTTCAPGKLSPTPQKQNLSFHFLHSLGEKNMGSKASNKYWLKSLFCCLQAVLLFRCKVVFNSVTSRTVAHQASLFMRFSRQEYWSVLPFPPPGDLPDPGIKPAPSAFAGWFSTTEPPGKCYSTIRLKRCSFLIWFFFSFHTWYFTSFNAILPYLPTLSLSLRVHKTVLYISVSFAVSYTGLLLPSF